MYDKSLPQFIAARGFIVMREDDRVSRLFFTYFKELVNPVINCCFSAAVN
jgi:hypothetical protein